MENYLLFVVMCILLIILPGPDTAIVTKNTLTVSKNAGIKTMMGTLFALMIHTTVAVLGLSAIIVKSALLFTVIKYIGAIYLIYLGIRTLISLRKRNSTTADPGLESKHSPPFLQGFLTNLLNPKVAVFFLTFLPQFVNTQTDPLVPFFLLGITYSILTAIWFVFYILLLNQIRLFMNKPQTQKWMELVTGSVLIGFGVKLALEKA